MVKTVVEGVWAADAEERGGVSGTLATAADADDAGLLAVVAVEGAGEEDAAAAAVVVVVDAGVFSGVAKGGMTAGVAVAVVGGEEMESARVWCIVGTVVAFVIFVGV